MAKESMKAREVKRLKLVEKYAAKREKLKAEANLSEEQALKAIEAIKNYIVEKFPMLEGAVGNLFGKN